MTSLARRLPIALIVSALVASPAAARPIDYPDRATEPAPTPAPPKLGLEYGQLRAERAAAARAEPAAGAPGIPRATTVTTVNSSFDWASAVVGAGIGTAALLLAAAIAMTASRRHRRVRTAR